MSNEFYNGNAKIKKTGVTQQFTPDQIEEYIKCRDDILYFVTKYCKIIALGKGLQLLDLYEFQKKMITAYDEKRFVINLLPRQMGKMQKLDTIIPTPTGFRKLGELSPGDEVFGEDGKPTTIKFVSERQIRPYYKITFDDGSSTSAADNHLWTVYSRSDRKGHKAADKHKPQTLTTQQILDSTWKIVNGRGYTEYAYYIPNCKPVDYEPREQKIDPYILGLWLGDGTSANRNLTCHIDDKPFYESQGVIFLGENIEKRPNIFTAKIGNFETEDLSFYNIKKRKTGEHTKHIPDDYLFGSVEQRLNLLQGLMDTDGFIGKNGRWAIQLTRKNQRLIDDVYTLLCSLGLKVSRLDCKNTNSERLSFLCSDLKICRIPRKLERQPTTKVSRYTSSRTIQNIEYIGEEEGVCIGVDNASHLYLCEKSYIPTHNSTAVAAYLMHYVLFNEHKTVGILANKAPTAREILNRIKRMYENLPLWMQPGVKTWNKGDIELGNGSVIMAASTSSDSIRGFSMDVIFLDEFAHVEGQVEFWESTYPVISSGDDSKVIITSTPKGMDLFHKIFSEAEKGMNDFFPIKVHWSDHPRRDERWKQTTLKNIGLEQFQQEFECVAGESMVNIFDTSTQQFMNLRIEEVFDILGYS